MVALWSAMLAIALVLPNLMAASPLMMTDVNPLQALLNYELSLDYEDRTPGPLISDEPSEEQEPYFPNSGLMKIFEDNDIRLEDKRSGLRAALAARMGRGSGPAGPQQLGSHVFIAPPSMLDGSFVSRRSQPANAPYLNVGKMAGAKGSKPGEVDYKMFGVLSNVGQYFKGLQRQLETLAEDPEEPPPSHLNNHFFGASYGGPRPATAAHLHALRSHGPSHRIRSFVEDPGPVELRGANSHDPALLWTGLGKR